MSQACNTHVGGDNVHAIVVQNSEDKMQFGGLGRIGVL
jgi:hypothetical protein